MRNKLIYSFLTSTLLFAGGCINTHHPAPENTRESEPVAAVTKDTITMSMGMNSKGIGRFTNVQLSHPLNNEMVKSGEAMYDAKCMACHKLTDEKLVGPGWKGVTSRRTPEWVLNFITNTQVMLDKDLVAQSEVVTCVVRMPNQDLTDDQARQIYEFMRKNDGKN